MKFALIILVVLALAALVAGEEEPCSWVRDKERCATCCEFRDYNKGGLTLVGLTGRHDSEGFPEADIRCRCGPKKVAPSA